jgi:hypothetical protein
MKTIFGAPLTALLRAAAFLLAAATLPSQAASVLPAQLDEIVDRAAVAFEGRCVANRTERDLETGLVVTYTTFEVIDRLKGAVAPTHTIKQIGGSLPDDNIQYKVEGVPTFNVGEDYVVFLARASRKGFSSPIALAQGRFGIRQSQAGREVGNGRDFRELTERLPQAMVPPRARARMQGVGPVKQIDLDDFKEIVRARVGGSQ